MSGLKSAHTFAVGDRDCCQPARFFTLARYSISSRPKNSSFLKPISPFARTVSSIASFSKSMKCGRYQSSTRIKSFCPASHTSRRDIGRTRFSAALRPTSFAIANASSRSFSLPCISFSTSLHGRHSLDCSL